MKHLITLAIVMVSFMAQSQNLPEWQKEKPSWWNDTVIYEGTPHISASPIPDDGPVLDRAASLGYSNYVNPSRLQMSTYHSDRAMDGIIREMRYNNAMYNYNAAMYRLSIPIR
jgi:hypothetical protein